MKRRFRLDCTFVGAVLLLATTSLLTTASRAHAQEERMAVAMSSAESAVRWTGVRVGTAEETRAAVDRFAELGFVQIKIYNELPADLVHVAIDQARKRGLRVSGHVPYAMTAREAVEAGFDEIQHVQMTLSAVPMPADVVIARGETWDTWYQVLAELTPESAPVRELIEEMASRGVALDATLGHFIIENAPPDFVGDGVNRFPGPVARRLRHMVFSNRYVPTSPLARPAWERSVENMFGLVAAAHEAGVPILVGTDTWAGFGLHYEMELLVRAGIAAPEVLTLATLGAARVMGMDDELGSIEPGKLADLILVDGDPTTDINDIRRVVTVIKDGRVYDPAAIYRALGVEPCCKAETLSASADDPPASPHYLDQSGLYGRGELKPVWTTLEEVRANAVQSYRPGEGQP